MILGRVLLLVDGRVVEVGDHRSDVSFIFGARVPGDGDGRKDADYEHDNEKLDERKATSAACTRTMVPSVERGNHDVAAHGEILTGSHDGIVKIDLRTCHDH